MGTAVPFARRVAEGEARTEALARAGRLPQIAVPDDLVHDLSNIAHGILHPLSGFLIQKDYASVVHRMRLSDDTPWTIPIVLDVSREAAVALARTNAAVLVHHGVPMALLDVSDVYTYRRDELASQVFGTLDSSHPGVAGVMAMQPLLAGGDITLLNEPDDPFRAFRLTPVETAILFREKGWRTVVGFQTRNIPHLGHEYLQKTALTFVDGIFINPLLGHKKVGDFRDDVVLKAYQALIEHYYLRGRTVLSVFRTRMRYAGPREAVFHAIVRRNFGCTHFVVGRDHAGVGGFYPPYAAQDIFQHFPDLGITPLFFTAFFHCRRCGGVVNEKICPHDPSARVEFSGTRLREALAANADSADALVRPEVAAVVRQWPNPFIEAEGREPEARTRPPRPAPAGPSSVSSREGTRDRAHPMRPASPPRPSTGRKGGGQERGFVVWLTGIPGSGKTTIGRLLEEELRHRGLSVEVLDGDDVRRNLSPDLGFSREARETHNRRVIYLAGLLARHGVAVIVPLISPYRHVREQARSEIPCFVEVWVKCAIEECIRRDPKGLYRQALAGEIKDLTGLQDVYEEPRHPELIVGTDDEGPAESTRHVVNCLGTLGYLGDNSPMDAGPGSS